MRCALACLILTMTGCSRSFEDPVEAYQAFAQAAQRGSFQNAFGMLSEATRHRVEAQSPQLARASGGSINDDPAGLLLTYLPPLQRPTRPALAVARRGTGWVVLSGAGANGPAEIRLVLENGAWKVDLAESL